MTDEQLTRFRSSGRLDIEADQRAAFIDGTFRAAAFDDDATLAEIARLRAETGMLVDPHTATATAAAKLLAGPGGPPNPMVTLATADPAKFPDAVVQATGVHPPLPDHLADLFAREERTQVVANDLVAVEALVESLTR